jgi:hypothetical protein
VMWYRSTNTEGLQSMTARRIVLLMCPRPLL